MIAAAGNIDHAAISALVGNAFSALPVSSQSVETTKPTVNIQLEIREKDLEQAHICLGTRGYEHTHPDRHASYILNAVLGGSMSSRLFQKIREKRGLAYAVSSGLTSYRDVGSLTVYAGCDGGAVRQVIDLVVEEMETQVRSILEQVSKETGIKFKMEASQCLIFDNYCILHNRTAYEDK